MEDADPRISIVIPCLNEAKFIARTINSIHSQNYDGTYEIVVVDNNCTDDTIAIAESLGARATVESEPGVCWARQKGTEFARGEIVISTDADTVFKENWLQTIDDTFKSNKKIIAVTGPCVYSDDPWWGKQYPKILFSLVSNFSKLFGRPFYVTATNIAFKKSIWEGYNTALTQGGDELGLLHELTKKGLVVFNNKNPVYTSGRRLYKGFVYNFFVTFLVYYVLAYYLDKIFNRPVLGVAPQFRSTRYVKSNTLLFSNLIRFAIILAIVFLFHLPGHDTFMQQLSETYTVAVKDIKEFAWLLHY